LITVRTTGGDHEALEIRVGGGEALYTISPNVVVTVFVPVEHLATLTTAIQAAIPSAVITSRPE
jgi:hypothetical protein